MVKIFIVVICAFFGLLDCACAEFVDNTTHKSNPFNEMPNVVVDGSDEFTVVNGMGDSLELGEVLNTIVPSPYKVVTPGLDPILKTKVSWKGGRPWNNVLRDVVAQVDDLQVKIDTTNKIAVFELKPRVVAAVGKEVTAASGPSVNSVDSKWTIRTGDKLSAVLGEWGKRAGWKVIFNADEIIAGADLTTEGTFANAIEQLMAALARGNSTLKAKFYRGNMILEITEK